MTHKKNKKKYIFLGIFGVVCVFLLLPVIFPDNSGRLPVGRRIQPDFREESPLPIFPINKSAEKYFNRLKSFYGFGDADNTSTNLYASADSLQGGTANIRRSLDEIVAGDIFQQQEQIDSNKENAKDTINLKEGTVLTKDGLLIAPTKNGYTYDGQFYKNGTYPRGANARRIEGALSRYHNALAFRSGKSAVYEQEPSGEMTVRYLTDKELAKELRSSNDSSFSKSVPPLGLSGDGSMLASSKYRGAKLNNMQNGNTSVNTSFGTGDIHGSYQATKAHINSSFGRYKENKSFTPPPPVTISSEEVSAVVPKVTEGDDFRKKIEAITCDEKKCLNKKRVVPNITFKSESEDFAVDNLQEFLESAGEGDALSDLEKINFDFQSSRGPANTTEEKFDKEKAQNQSIEEVKQAIKDFVKDKRIKGEEINSLEFLSLLPSKHLVDTLNKLNGDKELKDLDIFLGMPKADRPTGPRPDFSSGGNIASDSFLERTGVETMLKAAGVKEDTIENIKEKYDDTYKKYTEKLENEDKEFIPTIFIIGENANNPGQLIASNMPIHKVYGEVPTDLTKNVNKRDIDSGKTSFRRGQTVNITKEDIANHKGPLLVVLTKNIENIDKGKVKNFFTEKEEKCNVYLNCKLGGKPVTFMTSSDANSFYLNNFKSNLDYFTFVNNYLKKKEDYKRSGGLNNEIGAAVASVP